MEMPEKMQQFLNAMGMVGEMSALLRDNLMRNGFTREEACSMVGQVLREIFGVVKKSDGNER